MYFYFIHRHQRWLKIDKELEDKIFVPNLRVKNAKNLHSGQEYGPSEKYFWLRYDGYLLYQERMRITVYCPLEFNDFPFDYHYCDFKIGKAMC